MGVRYHHLYPAIWQPESLYAAYKKAARGKRANPEVAEFEYDLELNLVRLEQALADESYQPGGYHSFVINRPKRRLTARCADMWNTCYFAGPETFTKSLADIRAACDDVGSDLDTQGLTYAISLNYPDLGDPPKMIGQSLTGTTEELVEAFHGYRELGMEHLMFHLTPYTQEAQDRLAFAVEEFRGK